MTTGRFKLDIDDERLWNGDKPVHLTNKAFRLLHVFIDNPDRLLTKDAILSALWGDVCVTEGLVKEYVHDLRVALGDDPKQPRFIETVRGRGYRYLGGIEMVDQSGPANNAKQKSHALTLAVLAFDNLSDDPEQDYFADGMSEDIIIGLSKNPHLSVISRNSSFAFKSMSVAAHEIGTKLDVQFVLVGSVRKTGKRIRVSAKLVDAADERHLWAQNYDRELGDIHAVQDDVVSSIVHALGATDGAIEKSVRQRLAKTSDTSLSAYDCYLKAQGYFYRRHGSGYDQAEALYERAIELDPTFARAYSGLAMLHFHRFKIYLTETFDNIADRTHQLAQRAVQLDPDDYLAHWVLGRLYGYSGKQSQSLAEFARALSINPNDANVHADFADFLVYCGQPKEALEHCQRAIRLNPNCPDWYWWNLGFSNFHLGRYDQALEALKNMTSPGQARRLLCAVYAHLGALDDARATGTDFLHDNPEFSIENWARTEPYNDPNELHRYVDGLSKAGLPI